MIDKTSGPMTDQLLNFYRTMLRIRRLEETVADCVEAGEIKTPCHFCIGQEAIPTGVCGALTNEDYVWGAHRSHGHYLAKGGDMNALMAEIFCRTTGCSNGRGGSMHICQPDVGVMGTVPIVAATIPIAVGAALGASLRKSGRVSVSFFGDGATEEGHFFESMNIAALYRLPAIFVCENNLYSSHMSLAQRRAKFEFTEFGTSHGLASTQVDGNDVAAVYDSAVEAVDRARQGDGPTLLEYRTFRWRGHVGPGWDMDVGVQRKDELQGWLNQDPIPRCAELLAEQGATPAELDQIARDVDGEVAEALNFAKASPVPETSELTEHVYRAA